jgi:VanZ family protein
VRKLGHIAEYLLLGLAICYAMKDKKKQVLKTALFCLVVSLVDQILKGYLPVREFDITDMSFDFIGYGIRIAIIYIFIKLIKRINRNERNGK